jgi:hypothetical protein
MITNGWWYNEGDVLLEQWVGGIRWLMYRDSRVVGTRSANWKYRMGNVLISD